MFFSLFIQWFMLMQDQSHKRELWLMNFPSRSGSFGHNKAVFYFLPNNKVVLEMLFFFFQNFVNGSVEIYIYKGKNITKKLYYLVNIFFCWCTASYKRIWDTSRRSITLVRHANLLFAKKPSHTFVSTKVNIDSNTEKRRRKRPNGVKWN